MMDARKRRIAAATALATALAIPAEGLRQRLSPMQRTSYRRQRSESDFKINRPDPASRGIGWRLLPTGVVAARSGDQPPAAMRLFMMVTGTP